PELQYGTYAYLRALVRFGTSQCWQAIITQPYEGVASAADPGLEDPTQSSGSRYTSSACGTPNSRLTWAYKVMSESWSIISGPRARSSSRGGLPSAWRSRPYAYLRAWR